MPVGFPAKTTYANGDVFSASDINDTNGTINLLQTSTLSQSSGKNAIINGGLDIWQRGTSFTNPTTRTYTADRFQAYRFGYQNNITTSRIASGLTGFTYAMRNQRTAADVQTGAFFIEYAIESLDSLRFAGQTVTFSFYARRGANYSPTSAALVVVVNSGTGTDQQFNALSGAVSAVNSTATLTTSWQRFTFTGSVPSNATQIGFQLTANPTGTAGANDWFDITGVQLELGSYATTFFEAGGTIQGELAACQRYYSKSYNIDTAPATNTSTGAFQWISTNTTSNGNQTSVNLPVAMRGNPGVVVYTPAGTSGNVTFLGTTNIAAALENIGNSRFGLFLTGTTSGVGSWMRFQWTADAEL